MVQVMNATEHPRTSANSGRAGAASNSEAEGYKFEPCRAHQAINNLAGWPPSGASPGTNRGQIRGGMAAFLRAGELKNAFQAWGSELHSRGHWFDPRQLHQLQQQVGPALRSGSRQSS